MEFPTISPSEILRPFIQYYWVCTSDENVLNEAMFPSGHVELCIDISEGNTIRHIGGSEIKMPSLEVLGQLTKPTSASVTKGTTVLVTRFYPYASSLFFPCSMSGFTNGSIDFSDVLKEESTELYESLMEQISTEKKIEVVDRYLTQRLIRNKRNFKTLKLVESICNQRYTENESFDIEKLARHYGVSERYIQKLFLDWVGISPKSFFNVQRFNKSLGLIQSANASLTDIAYQCGYYDQAHFIKAFKSYTGMTPSQLQ